MENYSKLSTEQLRAKKRSLYYTQMGAGAIGMVAGFVYADRTGGGFWRYVGFGLMGSISIGAIGYFNVMPKMRAIEAERDTRVLTGSSPTTQTGRKD